MPYYVHWLQAPRTDRPRYVRATEQSFEDPDEANAFASALDPMRRALVTGSETPPDLEEKDQSQDVT
jgi:hypothetical protein